MKFHVDSYCIWLVSSGRGCYSRARVGASHATRRWRALIWSATVVLSSTKFWLFSWREANDVIPSGPKTSASRVEGEVVCWEVERPRTPEGILRLRVRWREKCQRMAPVATVVGDNQVSCTFVCDGFHLTNLPSACVNWCTCVKDLRC